jgi:Flagellar hook-length control protein FliK
MFDARTLALENTIPVDRPLEFASVPSNEVHAHNPRAATHSSHRPGSFPVERRTELTEVVRQDQTMITEYETRSTIPLEPAKLGRLTLELVDAPEGQRAYVSAEDPAVLRFLERNVQILETEARLQGVGQESTSVEAGFFTVLPNQDHTDIPHTATQSAHSPGRIPGEPRTELSEVVRQVRTMVTEYETRSSIQLEPAELGRLTLELVDAPEGLRAHVSAEDPAVMRFLERNVQLLETEARLQGVGHMSFSVGADVSGGLGRGDPRQSEAEASVPMTTEWNTAPHAKPRSRRELDTSA